MDTQQELEKHVKFIKDLANAVKGSEWLPDAATSASSKLEAYKSAVSKQETANAARAAAEIKEIVVQASQIASVNSPTLLAKYGPIAGAFVLTCTFFILGYFLWTYVNGVGLAKLSTIEGTRPLLVIAAIISTILYGGALLLGSLFSNEGTFEERFRHSEKVFLVFSGIFGTVVGYYFGAGESKSAPFSIDATLDEKTGGFVAYAVGGTPPYKFTATFGPKACTKTQDSKDGWANFAFKKDKDNVTPIKLSATDSKGLVSTVTKDSDSDALKKENWVLPKECDVGPKADAAPAAPETKKPDEAKPPKQDSAPKPAT